MTNNHPKCPHCGSSNFIKSGHDKFKNQMLFCKDCKCYFKLTFTKKFKSFPSLYLCFEHCNHAVRIYKNPQFFYTILFLSIYFFPVQSLKLFGYYVDVLLESFHFILQIQLFLRLLVLLRMSMSFIIFI